MSKKLLLLDAYALIYRAYFAFINRPMKNSKGLNTSAIFGFTKTMLDTIKKIEPSHVAVAFDLSGPTFRNEIYSEYKANRQETPEDIRSSVPIIKDLLRTMNIPILELQGYEADDIIGTAAKKAEPLGYEVYMMTPDKDYGQLLSPNIKIIKPGRGGNEMEMVTAEEFCKGYEIKDPAQFIDILALWGDASDNIKGVNKIGEKTAAKLISTYGSIDNILANTDKLSPSQRENLDAAHELLKLNRVLVTIKTDLDLKIAIDDLDRKEPNLQNLKKLLEELEFRSLLKEFQGEPVKTEKKETAIQGSLFGEEIKSPEIQKNYLKTLKDFKYDYRVASTKEERKSLIEELYASKEFAFDTETTGLDIITSQIVGMSFATAPFKAWYVPIPANQVDANQIISEFKEILEDPNKPKIGQNIKFDLLMVKNYNINLSGFLFDTMLAHYLLEPEQRHNLNIISEQLLGYKPIEIDELIGKKGASQISMRSVPLDKISIYASEDADLAFQLKEVLFKRLEQENLFELYKTIEEPLIHVLAEIERTGVAINTQALNEFAKTLNKELIILDDDIKSISGVPDLNISSPKQLGEVLFEKLKIATDVKLTKTKQYATGEEELVKYKDNHPIVDKILEFRMLKKLLSTYVEALPLLVNSKTGKIHASFNQAVASTGRLSSNNPNLQNIPIRDEKGREIRKAFVPSSEEFVILSADYSQIELRLMAHVSADPSMLEAFHNGEDIHTATASKIFKVPLAEVSREQRGKAKTANFGMIYGISAFGLSQRLSISRTEAKDLIDGYFGTYKGVKDYMDSCIKNAREKGWVATIFGRKRYLTDINSNNGTVRGLAERNAINAPIQGSAADVIKVAMINIHSEFMEKSLKSKMIIQVHDELVFEVYRPELDVVKDIVSRCMIGAVNLSVQLEIEMGVGSNWLVAH
ncbi:MAG: DNA polymerase I [Tenuifilaceae bacterium]